MRYGPSNIKKHCTPVGPSFKRARHWQFGVERTQIEFRTPKHQPWLKGNKPILPHYKQSLYKDLIFRSEYNEGFHIADQWRGAELFAHRWRFKGPWFTGVVAELSLYMAILRPNEPNPDSSYFHPRAFEQTVGDYLTNKYGGRKSHGAAKFIAPLNWQPLSHLPVPAVRLQVACTEIFAPEPPDEYLFFPIGDQYLVYMVFIPHRRGGGTQAERDALISKAPLYELIDNIVNSLNVSLSPEAQAQQQKALAGLEDTSLIETFPPIKWTTPEEDAEWARYREESKEYYDQKEKRQAEIVQDNIRRGLV